MKRKAEVRKALRFEGKASFVLKVFTKKNKRVIKKSEVFFIFF